MKCRRSICGGLLLTRRVVTSEGAIEEVYCVACARISASRVLAPYPAYRVQFRAEVEAALDRAASRSSTHADRDSDDTMGIVWPRDVPDEPSVDRGWLD